MADKTSTFTIEIDKFKLFIQYIKELSLIDPTVIVTIDDTNIILYSFVGKDINDIHAFKSIISPTDNIISKKRNIDNKITMIIKEGKKFVRNSSNFIDYEEPIKIKISYDDEDLNANYMHISNSKLRLKEISGDPLLMSKEITKDDIEFLTNKSRSLFNFEINEMDFRKIKRMSLVETTNDILYLNIDDKNLSIGENKWDIKICEIDKPNLSVSFPKKYFNILSFKENSKVYLFENYILVSDYNSDLMIVLETSV